MNIAGFYRHVMEALWAVGGIGASADLNMEDFGSHWASSCPSAYPPGGAFGSTSGGPGVCAVEAPAQSRSVVARSMGRSVAGSVGVRGARRTPKPVFPGGPLEAELCRNCCSKRSVR